MLHFMILFNCLYLLHQSLNFIIRILYTQCILINLFDALWIIAPNTMCWQVYLVWLWFYIFNICGCTSDYEKVCVRCGKRFDVYPNGTYPHPEECIYHWGKAWKKKSKTSFNNYTLLRRVLRLTKYQSPYTAWILALTLLLLYSAFEHVWKERYINPVYYYY